MVYSRSLQTSLLELYRNLNHSLNITTHVIDIGLFTTMLWTFQEREKLINFIEGLTGTRFHVSLLLLGRLRYDIYFSGCSKYSMLGCIRIISQLISFELLSSSLVMIYVYSFNDLSITNYWFILKTYFLIFSMLEWSSLLSLILLLNNHLFFCFFLFFKVQSFL